MRLRAATHRRALALGALLGGLARAALAAEPPRVTVIRPVDADPAMREVATRTQAELAASGIAADTADCLVGDAACRTRMSGVELAAAMVATFRDAGEIVIEVSARSAAGTGRGTARTVVRARNTDADPKVLAIRAVELVRATLLATSAGPAAMSPSEVPAVSVARGGEPPAEPSPPTSVGLGVAWLESLDGLGGELALAGRAEHLIRGGLGVGMMFVGPSLGHELPTQLGRLSVHQAMAAVEVGYRWRRQARLQPRLSACMGGYHLSATGKPDDPSRAGANNDELWAGVACAGGGAMLTLGRSLALLVDARAVFTAPRAAVETGTGLVHAGNPSLLVSVAMQTIY